MSGDTDDLFGRAPLIARVIDYETSGLPEDDDATVIEFGRIDVNLATLEIGNAWSALADPRRPIQPQVRAVHHITDAELRGHPLPGDRWGEFWAGCGPDDVVAAHNAAFERHFHDGNGRPWVCTYKAARAVWPEAPSHGNQALRYWLALDDDPGFDPARAQPAHRALPDAYVTAHLLVRLLRLRPIAELIQITKEPVLLRDLTFGKHRGVRYADAPIDYLEWIVDKSDLDADTKHTARYWLRERGARH